MSVAPGSRFGHYRIIEPLGAGGMGEVWLADDVTLKRKIALKVLPASVAADPERLARFQREAEAVAALTHPNIVTIHSIEQHGDVRFLTMELVDGQSLDRLIPRSGMPLVQILDIGSALADALAASHQKGIVHRDVKPANVMLTADRRVKVLDFGLAKLKEDGRGEETTITDASGKGRLLGTVAYMSPEQAEGQPVDARSDLFSLGVVLFEMATGDRPFKGGSNVSTLSAILRDTPRPVTDIRSDVPRDFDRILRRALQKDPEQRYQTAKDLRNDLQLLKADLSSGSAQAQAPPVAVGVPRRSRNWMMAAAAILILGVGAAGAWWTKSQGPASRPFESIKLKLLTDTGNAAFPVVSPDGRYVVYTSRDRSNLWLRQTATGGDVSIAPPGFGGFHPVAFSPDGNVLYFNAMQVDTKEHALYSRPTLAGAPRKIVDEPLSASVSPDGSQLAYILPTGTEAIIFLASPDGSRARRLAGRTLPEIFYGLSWSADGHSLATLVRPGTSGGVATSRIAVIDVQTGRQRDLGPLPIRVIPHLTTLPDGRGFLVVGSEPNASNLQIWLMPEPGGPVHRVTNDLNSYGGPTVTADGQALVAEQRSFPSGLWVYDTTDPQSVPRQVASSRTGAEGASGLEWLKDGRLLYASTASGNPELWSMATDGTPARQLTFNAGADINPVASPDGAYIVWQSERGAGLEIWRMNADGSNARQLSREGVFPFFGPDARSVFYRTTPTAIWKSWRMSIDGSENREFRELDGVEPLVISPDGRWIAGYRRDEGGRGFGIIAVDGTGPWRPLPLPSTTPPAALRWTPDGRALAHVRSERGVGNVWRQPIDGSAATRLTNFTSLQISRIAWSRDGRTLALARGETTSDLVMITTDTKK
jgi:eukaryotic-like serine/threonine-protein kinase